MKQTKLFLIIVVLIATFASCKDSTKNLADSIPASAAIVVHFDTKSILKKADYKPFDNKILKKAFDEQKEKGGERNNKVIVELEKFIKNPNSCGINIIDDMLMYVDGEQMGLLWGVNDSKKIKDLIVNTFEMPEEMAVEKDGVTIVSSASTVVVGWTNDKLLVLVDMSRNYYSDDKVDLAEVVKTRLTQNADQSINSNEAFVKFIANKQDISMFYAYDNYMGMMDTMWQGMLGYGMAVNPLQKMFEEYKELLKGVSAGAYVSFEKGEVTFNQEIYFASSESEKKYNELSAQLCGELKGEQLTYFSQKPIFLAAANLKGQGIYDYLTKMGLISMIEENAGGQLTEFGIDLKSVMSNVEGDVTFALNNVVSKTKRIEEYNYEYTTTVPEMTLLIDLKDASSTWNLIKENIAKVDNDSVFKATSPTTYTLNIDDMDVYMGVDKNTLYITNNELLKNNIGKDQKNEFASMGKGKMGFVYGNIAEIKSMAISQIDNDLKLKEFATRGLDLLGDYSLVAEKNMTAKGKLVITDDSANSLAVICKFVDSVITYAVEKNR